MHACRFCAALVLCGKASLALHVSRRNWKKKKCLRQGQPSVLVSKDERGERELLSLYEKRYENSLPANQLKPRDYFLQVLSCALRHYSLKKLEWKLVVGVNAVTLFGLLYHWTANKTCRSWGVLTIQTMKAGDTNNRVCSLKKKKVKECAILRTLWWGCKALQRTPLTCDVLSSQVVSIKCSECV